MKYSIAPAEKIRKSLQVGKEEFSFRIGYSHQSYRNAVERDYLTKAMARAIARIFKLSMSDFTRDGK